MTGTIRLKFEAFIEAHPEVYAGFVNAALKLKREGRESYAAWAIVQGLRWNKGKSIPNNYISLLARRSMLENPELQGFFKLNPLKE